MSSALSATWTVVPIASSTPLVAWPMGTCHGLNSPWWPRIVTSVTSGKRHSFTMARTLITLPTPLDCMSSAERSPPATRPARAGPAPAPPPQPRAGREADSFLLGAEHDRAHRLVALAQLDQALVA